MTPQAFSYPTLSSNQKLFIPPYGLNESLDYMLVMDLETSSFKKIKIEVSECFEKWQTGLQVNDKIYWLPYNEDRILVVDINTHEVSYINTLTGKGKWICPHIYQDKIIALPYGEHDFFDQAIVFNTTTNSVDYITISTDINDEKKWHTTQIIDNKLIGVPRGENIDNYFPYAIEFNCDNLTYTLTDLSKYWIDYDTEKFTNKKFTTLAKYKNKLYAPPYSENSNFDVMLSYHKGKWQQQRLGIQSDSRKYYSHTVARNGKIYFPPAGHQEDWSLMLIVNGENNSWYTKDLQIGKESKKYFAGTENSQGKIYYIPRGGCVCEPEYTWKSQGDLAEVLVIDTSDDSYYTVDVSNFFTDSTTIEKYNHCIIHNDIIYAFPYGESSSFQTVLIFDTIQEKVIRTIDLNEL